MARKTLLTESEIRQFMKLANLGPLGDAKIEEMYGTAPGNRDKEEHKKEMTEADSDEEGGEDVHEKPVAEEIEDVDEGRGGGGGKAMNRDEDELDEMGMRGAMDRDEDEMMGDAEMDMDADADDMDMDADADMDAMDDGEREQLMADVVRAVASALGIEDQVSVEAGEDDGMEGGDMDAMPEPALDDEPAEPDMAMGADDEDDEPMMEADDDDDEHARARKRAQDAKARQRDRASRGGVGVKGVTREEINEDDLVAEVARRVAQRLQTENRKEAMVDALAERIMKRLTK